MNGEGKGSSRRDACCVERRQFIAGTLGGACLAALAVSGPARAGNGGKGDKRSVESEDSRIGLAPARYYEKLDGLRVECTLCPRHCRVADLERGYCGVRENRGGRYFTLVHSRPCALHNDPIEKKPLFHFLPGTQSLSLATAGCNMECRFCQNWRIAQFRPEQVESIDASPETVVSLARKEGSRSIAFTYSEPVVFYEYMQDIARLSRKQGIGGVMISNGYICEEPIRELAADLAAVKIDLKAFTEDFYRELCSASLEPVLETLKRLKKAGIWFEIVVLLLPTKNDGPEEIRRMCQWIAANLGPDVPVHFSRFHPMYKVQDLPVTPVKTLEMALRTARDAGLHFPYLGNVPGHPGETTRCPGCGGDVVVRVGYKVVKVNLKHGACASCGRPIPGIWEKEDIPLFQQKG